MYHTLLCFQHTVKNSGGGHNCALMHFDHREASRLQASIVYGRASVEASFLQVIHLLHCVVLDCGGPPSGL